MYCVAIQVPGQNRFPSLFESLTLRWGNRRKARCSGEAAIAPMNASDETADRSAKLPTRSQLRAEAFGLAPRTPEWLKVERIGGPSKSDPPVPPSADETWVVAASRSDGWVLERFAALLEHHAIHSEVDRAAGLLRVHRSALRAALHLLRTHRRQLRRSKAARERKIVDGVLLGMVGPPFVLAGVLTVIILALSAPQPATDKLLNAAYLALLLTVFFTARAALAAIRWLTYSSRGVDAAQPDRDGADYPPAP